MEQLARIKQITKAANALQLDAVTLEQVEALIRAAARDRSVRLALEESIEAEYERLGGDDEGGR